jgi:O-antigen/teichoic acid export membrane protein
VRADTTRFWTDAGVMAAGQAVYVVSQWGMLVVLAHLAGPAAVGRFALALAVTAPIMLFSNLALRPALVTDVRGEHGVRRYLALRASTTALALVAIAIAVMLLQVERESAPLILIVALAKAFENLSDILYGIAQRHERFTPIALSLGARGLLGLLAFALGIWRTGDVIVGAALLAASWAGVLLLFDWPAGARWRSEGTATGPPRTWLRLAGQVLPLGVAGALIALNASLPRYLIAHRLGAAELGRFAAMASFIAAGAMLVMVLGQTASPRLARAAAAGDRQSFLRLMATIALPSALLGGIGVLAATLFHETIMVTFYGTRFSAGSELLPWVMSAGLASFVSACFGFGLTALRLFRTAPWLYGATCALTLAGGVLLAPSHGLTGIVVAWLGALVVNLLLTGGANLIGLAALRREAPPSPAAAALAGGRSGLG